MWLYTLLACTDSGGPPGRRPDTDPPAITDTSDTIEDTGPVIAEPSVSIAASGALDPLRSGRVDLALELSPDTTARVVVLDDSGAEVVTLAASLTDSESFSWGGDDDAGDPLPLGAYTVVAYADRNGLSATAEDTIYVVEMSAASGALGGERLPLTWHRAGGTGGYWSGPTDAGTFALSELEQDGQAAPIPEPWSDLEAPPPLDALDVNWPAGYRYDALPTLTIELAGDLAGFGGHLQPHLSGWSLTDGVAIPGGSLTFTRNAPIARGPAVVEERAVLELMDEDSVVMSQEIPLRMYAFLDADTFTESGPAYGAWLAAVDPALRSLDGVDPTDDAVLDGLVAFIFEELGLSYDTRYGASSYVSYRGGNWTRAHFNFTAFLQRSNGSVINCTDAAAILGAYANMVGADLSYMILNPNFELNYILSIGGSQFTRCPFGPGGCGFSYHAITSPDGGATIYDATLAIDGDSDPGSPPHTQTLVQGISGDGYQDAIVRSGSPSYHSASKGTLQ